MCKIGTFQWNLSTIFLKLLNIYLFSKILQKVKIVMLRQNILQYFTKIFRQYFNCNKRLEIFVICFCNILCYVGNSPHRELMKLRNACKRCNFAPCISKIDEKAQCEFQFASFFLMFLITGQSRNRKFIK